MSSTRMCQTCLTIWLPWEAWKHSAVILPLAQWTLVDSCPLRSNSTHDQEVEWLTGTTEPLRGFLPCSRSLVMWRKKMKILADLLALLFFLALTSKLSCWISERPVTLALKQEKYILTVTIIILLDYWTLSDTKYDQRMISLSVNHDQH